MPIPHTTIVSEMKDITSEHRAMPFSNSILPLFSLSNDAWDGAIYRLQNLTDVSLNPIKEVHLSSANEWLANSFDRDREVQEFYRNVSGIINDSTSDTSGRPHSSIFVSISGELNYLAESKADYKVLLVYSDLMENMPDFSLYQPKDLEELNTTPDKVRSYFLKIAPLSNLKGIEVHFIYQPEGTAENSNYQLISSFYKSLLESFGAKVSISANLIN